MWLLWLSIGTILGALTNFIPRGKSKPKYLRRGIITKSYQVSSMGVKTGEFEVQLEVGELERTDKKSKIVIINCIPSGSQHADKPSQDKIRKLVDNSWNNSDEIEWITENISDVRNSKIK